MARPEDKRTKKELIVIFEVAVKRIASLLKKHPRDVSLHDYRRHKLSTDPSERQIQKHDGFSAFIDKAFPFSHPFEGMVSKSYERSQQIATLILQCANDKRIAPHEVTWDEFRYYLNLRYGTNDKGLSRYLITKTGGFNAVRDAYYPPIATELTVEKRRVHQQATMNRRLGLQMSEYQFTLDRLKEYAETVFSGLVNVPTCPLPKDSPSHVVTNLALGDLHIGSDISSEETGASHYGVKEESRRLAFIIRELCMRRLDRRAETELNVLLLGDIIQNSLHDARDGAALAEQMVRAIHNLVQSIAHLSAHFKVVNVYCAVGNHGRFTSRHKGRAIHERFDAAETVIYFAVKSACSNLGNVNFTIPKTPYVTYPLFDKQVFACHGDTVFDPGNPGKSIQVFKAENQANKWNASLADTDEYAIFVAAHIHTGSVSYLGNGNTLITNGALVPPDPFTISLGIPESQCGQIVWDAIETNLIENVSFIKVGSDQDKDEELDKIIQPWQGF